MASTASAIQTIIDNIDTEISTLIATPDKMISYRIGDKHYNRKDAVTALLELRKYYHGILQAIPAEHVGEFDIDETEFGEDDTYYVDSSNNG